MLYVYNFDLGTLLAELPCHLSTITALASVSQNLVLAAVVSTSLELIFVHDMFSYEVIHVFDLEAMGTSINCVCVLPGPDGGGGWESDDDDKDDDKYDKYDEDDGKDEEAPLYQHGMHPH